MEINVSKGVKIGGRHIAVKSGKEINEKLNDGGFYGKSYYSETEIAVDSSYPSQQISNTFIHEAIHFINNIFDTHLSESQIRRLANGWHQVMEQYGITFVVGNPSEDKEEKQS